MFETVWQDVRYGVRLLCLSPLFTLTAALSLAIGIGANTTIFSVASGLLLRPQPGVADPGRLVDIGRTQNGRDFDNSSYPNYRDVRARVTTLSDVPSGRCPADGSGRWRGTDLRCRQRELLLVLGARPHLGRLLMDTDDEGAQAVPSNDRYELCSGGSAETPGS